MLCFKSEFVLSVNRASEEEKVPFDCYTNLTRGYLLFSFLVSNLQRYFNVQSRMSKNLYSQIKL